MEPGAAAGTLALLEKAGLAYVCVDEPQVERTSTPPVVAATAPLAYVRLHGRNADTWGITTRRRLRPLQVPVQRRGARRSGYPRCDELARQAATVHVLFNNNYEDWGMRNARRMAQLLGAETGPAQGELPLG